ncbi:hypothetical protein D3C72_905280 [compost metagenome]|jgi:ribosomal protein L37AE/L43A
MTTPSEQEEQWFKDQELKARREREAAEAAASGTQDLEARRQAHFMKCPKCGGDLSEHDHEGIKIDSCNDCKGVWLDAGELEQLTAEKSSGLLGFLRGRK